MKLESAKKREPNGRPKASIVTLCGVIVVIVITLYNNTFASTKERDGRTSISLGHFRIRAERLFKNTSIGNGGIRINLKNCELTKQDGSVQILAQEAVVVLKLESVIRMKIKPQILSLKHAVIGFYPKNKKGPKQNKKPPAQNKTKEKLQTLESILALLEDNLSVFDEGGERQGQDFEDIRVIIRNKSGEEENLYIDQINIKKAEQTRLFKRYLEKNYSTGTFAATIKSQSGNYGVQASCSVREFGKLCEVAIAGVSGALINPLLYRNNRQLLAFQNLGLTAKAEFGSHLGGKRIRFTAYVNEGSHINMWTGKRIKVGPTKSSIELDTEKKTIVMQPTIISADGFGVGEFGLEIGLMHSDSIHQKYSWNIMDIPARGAWEVLDLLGGISKAMKNAMSGIKENIAIGGDNIRSCQGRIVSQTDIPMSVDIKLDMRHTSCTIAKLNSLLVRDIDANIKVSEKEVKVNIESFRVGNHKVGKGLVRVLGMNSDTPILDVLVSGEIPLAMATDNPSMPGYADKIRQFVGINKEANLSGEIKASVLLLGNRFSARKHFSYDSQMNIENMDSSFLVGEKGVKVFAQKRRDQADLEIRAETAVGTQVQMGPELVIREPDERTLLSFRIKHIFSDTKTTTKDKDKTETMYFENIQMLDGTTQDELASLDLECRPDDIFIKSQFDIKIHKFKLLNSHITGSFGKRNGRDYRFSINGSQVDWRKAFRAYLFLRGKPQERSFGTTNIKGYMSVDKLIMFNDIEAQSLHLKSVIKRGVFKDLQLSADLQKNPKHKGVAEVVRYGPLRRVIAGSIEAQGPEASWIQLEPEDSDSLGNIASGTIDYSSTSGGPSLQKGRDGKRPNKAKARGEQPVAERATMGQAMQSAEEGGANVQKKRENTCQFDREIGAQYGMLLRIAKDPHKNTVSMQIENVKMLFEGLNIATQFFGRTKGFSIMVKGTQIGGNNSSEAMAGVKSSIRGSISLGGEFCYMAKVSGGKERSVTVAEGTTNFDLNLHKEVLQLRDLVIKTDLIRIKAFGYMDFYENMAYLNGRIYLPQRKQSKNDVANTEIPILGQAIKSSIESKSSTAVLSFVIDGPIDEMSEHVTTKPSRPLLFLGSVGGIGLFGILIGLLTILL